VYCSGSTRDLATVEGIGWSGGDGSQGDHRRCAASLFSACTWVSSCNFRFIFHG